MDAELIKKMQEAKRAAKPISHEIRTNRADGKGRKFIPKYSRKIAIVAHCTECLGFEGNPSVDCTSPNCALYPYRGKTHIGYEKE